MSYVHKARRAYQVKMWQALWQINVDVGGASCHHIHHLIVAEIFYMKHGDQRGFFQFKIIINVLVSFFAPFEYLCNESTAIINVLIFSVRRPSL